MDLLLLLLGGVLLFIGSKNKDLSGNYTSTGKGFRIMGFILLAIGIVIIIMATAVGFSYGFMQAIR